MIVRDIKVLPIGCKVHLGIGEERIEGVVEAVQISGEGGSRIMYQVAWWNGRVRQENWLESFELQDAGSRTPLTIGFKQ